MSLHQNFKCFIATRRPITGKFIHYHDDGTGRDNYISTAYGGLQVMKESRAKSNWKGFRQASRDNWQYPSQPIHHYPSDGSGRDQYIVLNEGGQSNTPNRHSQQLFERSLRNWRQNSPCRTHYTNPVENSRQKYQSNKLSAILPRSFKYDEKEAQHKPNLETPYMSYNGNYLQRRNRALSKS